jgi:hypothetical protein
MEELTHQLGWALRVLRIPHIGKNEIISSDESRASIGRGLVDHDLRTSSINNVTAHRAPLT